MNLTAAQVVDEWMERVRPWSEEGDVLGIEYNVSVIAGSLAVITQALAVAENPGDTAGPVLRELADRRDPLAHAMLLTLARLGTDELTSRAALAAEARQMQGTATALPDWLPEYETAVELVECGELDILDDPDRVLLLSFTRSGISHGIALCVNDAECGEATEVMLLDDTMPLKEGLAKVAGGLLESGTRFAYTPLDPAETRYRIETALAARTDHDANADPQELVEELNAFENDEDPPTYFALLPLLRDRLKALPAHDRPLPPHDDPTSDYEGLLQTMERITLRSPVLDLYDLDVPLSAMPAKRREQDGPAPVLRLRIDLKYMKPPIWRRLEVPADMSLADLDEAIQIAFEWENEHLHAFRTAYGSFGNGTSRLTEQHDEAAATIEQLLPTEGAKIEYVYDFGDEWIHVIKLEKTLPPEPGLVPRCTSGRRAAPQEDVEDPWAYLDGAPDVLDQNKVNLELKARFARR